MNELGEREKSNQLEEMSIEEEKHKDEFKNLIATL